LVFSLCPDHNGSLGKSLGKMASPLAEVYSPPVCKLKFSDDNDPLVESEGENCSREPCAAPRFKYRSNFPEKDIQEIRKLLTTERQVQDETCYDFWRPDYERMMIDDWLVTRFLLRGTKLSQNEDTCVDESAIYARTMDLIRACAKFRLEYRINGSTKEDEFPFEWTKINGLFNYKPDLAGNQTIYLRVKLHRPREIESKKSRHEFKRMLLYTLEKCDQNLVNRPGKGVCCVFDMSDATFENIDIELLSWMIKSFKSCSPKLLCYVMVYNLPWFFCATFKLVSKTLMSKSNKQSLKFVYGDEILDYISPKNLPPYLAASL